MKHLIFIKITNSTRGFLNQSNICLSDQLLFTMIHFRILNHKMLIWTEKVANIPCDEKLCSLCDTYKIGDEFYYMLQCKYFASVRDAYYILPAILEETKAF